MIITPGYLPTRFRRLDTSMLKCGIECPRKMFYQYGLNWQETVESHHLVFGRAIHAAMEVFNHDSYTAEAATKAFEAFREIYDAAVPPEIDLTRAPKDKDAARRMLDLIVDRHAKTYYKTAMLDGKPLIEVTNEYPMKFDDGTELIFVYKIDVVKVDGYRVYVVDYKTASKDDSNLRQKYTMDFQMNNYNLMLLTLFPAELVGGVIINVLLFRKGTTKAGVVERGLEIKECRSEIPPSMVPARMQRLQAWMVRFLNEALQADDELRRGTALTAFPQNSAACFNWGRRCEFYELCETRDDVFGNMHLMPTHLEHRVWLPGSNDKEL